MAYVVLFLKILLVLIAVESVISILRMMRCNIAYDDRKDKAVDADLVRYEHRKAGKGGILSTCLGVYRLDMDGKAGEFVSANPYGTEAKVPKKIRVVPMEGGGVLERCDIEAHFTRQMLPLWVAAGAFAAFVIWYIGHVG